jgi:hypothetical protein
MANFYKILNGNFYFQISKMKNFIFFKMKIFNFSFQIFVKNFKIVFFIFSISYGHFFQNSKTKIFNSNFKNNFFFKFFHFKFSL